MSKFLPPTFRALHLPSIMFFHGEDSRKLLIAFQASIIITGHPISLLSLSHLRYVVQKWLTDTEVPVKVSLREVKRGTDFEAPGVIATLPLVARNDTVKVSNPFVLII